MKFLDPISRRTMNFRAAESQGVMDIDEARPVTDDVIFRIASMTKLITSVAVMTLYALINTVRHLRTGSSKLIDPHLHADGVPRMD